MNGVLLVASPGGHIDELHELARRLPSWSGERMWVTARTPQTTSLLDAEDVEWVPPVGARQAARALSSVPTAARVIRTHRPRFVVSTGAALSVPYLLAARTMRVETHFVESATRLAGPSMTGRMAEWIPGVVFHHQATSWPRRRWTPLAGVFDGFESVPVETGDVRRVVVTLGTERFPFTRATEVVTRGLNDQGIQVEWQTGHTPSPSATLESGQARSWWPFMELAEAVAQADAVVTHGGVGSILLALRHGLCPVVIPRRAGEGEHVDDHQMELSDRLSQAGLVVLCQNAADMDEALDVAASRRVVRTERNLSFPLGLNRVSGVPTRTQAE